MNALEGNISAIFILFWWNLQARWPTCCILPLPLGWSKPFWSSLPFDWSLPAGSDLVWIPSHTTNEPSHSVYLPRNYRNVSFKGSLCGSFGQYPSVVAGSRSAQMNTTDGLSKSQVLRGNWHFAGVVFHVVNWQHLFRNNNVYGSFWMFICVLETRMIKHINAK